MIIISESGEVIEDPLKVAEQFNTYLKDKILKLAAKIKKHVGFDPLKKLKEKMGKLEEKNGGPLTFNLETVQTPFVLKVLKV